MADDPTIEALFDERRTFPPPPGLGGSPGIYAAAEADPEAWWAGEAARLAWRRPWDTVLDWSNAPFARWFVGGRLNVTESCLDRHVAGGAGGRVAIHWEGEPGDTRRLTYAELLAEVCRLANALRSLGVGKGDRVAIYMGMVPELPVALLACARIGAPHSVVFGGFSADALADRINDSACKALITCDGARRNGGVIELKAFADAALARTPSVTSVVVVRRVGAPVQMVAGRDHFYDELVGAQPDECAPEEMDAEDVLYLLYTSGTTGRPKGIVHTCGGYLTGVATTHRLVFDLRPEADVYWCAADIGWVTGHSYIVYGPLANGTTSVMFEGVPNYPDKDRFWEIVERYGVTQCYMAPTAIRTMMRWGTEYPARHDLSSLRVIGTVGEPINPEAWMWYRTHIGGGRCPVVDTWWQTETGNMMISALPGLTTLKPGSATFCLPGIAADVVDEAGSSVPLGGGGYLVLTRPWPGMCRTLYRDDQRFVDTYWSRFSDPSAGRWVYFAGDGAKRDAEGYYWLLGRVDDVMNVSGHRISTAEVESALVDHPAVAEAAVVGRADELTGQAIAAFVTLRSSHRITGEAVAGDEPLVTELRSHVAAKIGKIARPASIVFTDELPKTRSGKIMRRLLRDVSECRQLGDVTTLANAEVVAEIAERAAALDPSPG
ncbi:MAG: acetate--CoA ligase [Acidimicrobiales bacterium]